MRLAHLLALLPAVAFGQALTVTVQGQSAVTVGKSGCGVTTQVAWTAQTTGIPCSDLTVWDSTSDCSAGPDAGTVIGTEPQSSWNTEGSGSFDLLVDDLPIFDGGTCGAAVDQTVNICAAYSYSSLECGLGDASATANPSATLRYDAVPPGAPTITAVNTLDGSLGVRISPASGAVEVSVEIRQLGDTTFQPATSYSADEGGTTVDGLTNGVTYEVRASVTDEAGNVGPYSEVAQGTPQPTAGFWATYLNDGGKEQGGCAAGGGTLCGLVVLAFSALRRRRMR